MSADNWAVCPRCERDRVLDAKGETFREDYEQGVTVDGEYFVSYHGKCTECGLEHRFEHASKLSY